MLIDDAFQRLNEFGNAPAIIAENGRSISYQELVHKISSWSRRLGELGIKSGEVVALDGDYSPEIIACFWALARIGAVIMPLTTHTPGHEVEFQKLAEVCHHLSFKPNGDLSHAMQPAEHRNELLNEFRQTGGSGLILFSSGSEGKPKIVLHSLERLLSKYKKPLVAARTLLFLVFDHIAGLDKMLYVISAGGCCVLETTRRPEKACAAIVAHNVENFPTTPSYLNLILLSEAWRGKDLSCVKVVTYGSETMSPELLKKIREIMPSATLINKYGTTELGSALSQSRDSDSVWLKLDPDHFQMRIVDGIFHAKSTTGMLGYLNAPSPFDRDGYINTGDLVEMDGEWLRFRGRKSEMINVGGEKLHAVEVEDVLGQIPGVLQVSVWGEKNPLLGQIVVAEFTLNGNLPYDEFKQVVREFCRGRLAPYKIPARIMISGREQHNYRFKKVRRLVPNA